MLDAVVVVGFGFGLLVRSVSKSDVVDDRSCKANCKDAETLDGKK